MDAAKILEQMSAQYPGKNIVLLPADNPTEIICEVDPTSDHPDYNVAVAVIDQSETHYHPKATEEYLVLSGSLILNADGMEITLETGDAYTIQPGVVHSAKGDSTWVSVRSEPGWTTEDHIIVADS